MYYLSLVGDGSEKMVIYGDNISISFLFEAKKLRLTRKKVIPGRFSKPAIPGHPSEHVFQHSYYIFADELDMSNDLFYDIVNEARYFQ